MASPHEFGSLEFCEKSRYGENFVVLCLNLFSHTTTNV